MRKRRNKISQRGGAPLTPKARKIRQRAIEMALAAGKAFGMQGLEVRTLALVGDKGTPSPANPDPFLLFPFTLSVPAPVPIPPLPPEHNGAPTKCTTDRCTRIFAALRAGLPRSFAAAMGGVGMDQLQEWLRREDYETFLVFQQHFAEAELYAAVMYLKVLWNCAQGYPGNPGVAFEFLARRYPEYFGKVAGQDGAAAVQHTTHVQHNQFFMHWNLKALSDADLDRLEELRVKATTTALPASAGPNGSGG